MPSLAQSFAVPIRSTETRGPAPGARSAPKEDAPDRSDRPGSERGAEPAPRSPAIGLASARDAVKRGLVATLRQVHRPTGALLFTSGVPNAAADVATAVAELNPPVPVLVVPSQGVLTESAEAEGAAALAGMVWTSGRMEAIAASGCTALGDKLPPGGSLALFVSAEGFIHEELPGLAKGRTSVFGVASPGKEIFSIRGGLVEAGGVGAMWMKGLTPIVESAVACKLVSEPFTVTKVEGKLLLELDGKPALDLLSGGTSQGPKGALTLLALHDRVDTEQYWIRPIRGVDPSRRAILVAPDVVEGSRVSFAVQDSAHSRQSIQDASRRAEQRMVGSNPTFALYLNCVGRGSTLYNDVHVDVRLVKKRFPRIPIAGMTGSFQIAPTSDGRAELQVLSGVLALFRSPS